MFQPIFQGREREREREGEFSFSLFPFPKYMNGHFMCRESIPVVTKNYIWHKNLDNSVAFLLGEKL